MSLREKKPGVVTDDLRKALGMEVGGAPPWLINMQRYGPPPSYPNLKIPGLNAPIPEGATYGFHPGGWGKPPVDEFGRPLYGDVFGTAEPEPEDAVEAPAPRELWGAMGDEDDEEEEDESEEEEDGDDQSALGEDEISAGISSVSSVPSGLATPDQINLRKETGGGLATPLSSSGVDTPDSVAHGAPPSQQQLYQVISQREAKVGGAAFGSSHTYNLPGQGGRQAGVGQARRRRARARPVRAREARRGRAQGAVRRAAPRRPRGDGARGRLRHPRRARAQAAAQG